MILLNEVAKKDFKIICNYQVIKGDVIYLTDTSNLTITRFINERYETRVFNLNQFNTNAKGYSDYIKNMNK